MIDYDYFILFSVYSSPVHAGASGQAAWPSNTNQLAASATDVTNCLVPAAPFQKLLQGAASVSSHLGLPLLAAGPPLLAGGSSIVSGALIGGCAIKGAFSGSATQSPWWQCVGTEAAPALQQCSVVVMPHMDQGFLTGQPT